MLLDRLQELQHRPAGDAVHPHSLSLIMFTKVVSTLFFWNYYDATAAGFPPGPPEEYPELCEFLDRSAKLLEGGTDPFCSAGELAPQLATRNHPMGARREFGEIAIVCCASRPVASHCRAGETTCLTLLCCRRVTAPQFGCATFCLRK